MYVYNEPKNSGMYTTVQTLQVDTKIQTIQVLILWSKLFRYVHNDPKSSDMYTIIQILQVCIHWFNLFRYVHNDQIYTVCLKHHGSFVWSCLSVDFLQPTMKHYLIMYPNNKMLQYWIDNLQITHKLLFFLCITACYLLYFFSSRFPKKYFFGP